MLPIAGYPPGRRTMTGADLILKSIVRVWRFLGNWRIRIALIVLGTLVIVGTFGIWALNADPTRITDAPRLAPPSAEWWLGTDPLSRALLPRVLDGTRVTIVLSVVAVSLTTIAGSALALAAAYTRGPLDMVVTRASDVLFAFPSMLLALLLSAVVGLGAVAAVVSIVFITLPLMIRVIRAAALGVVHREFVLAAHVCGATTLRILVAHVLPNVAGSIVVQATYAGGVAMLIEGGLSFLGLGVQPPDASLGSLVREGSAYLSIAPWLVAGPGLVLALAIFSLNLLGDGLRDRLDPLRATNLD